MSKKVSRPFENLTLWTKVKHERLETRTSHLEISKSHSWSRVWSHIEDGAGELDWESTRYVCKLPITYALFFAVPL
jgi:hypothetical protein